MCGIAAVFSRRRQDQTPATAMVRMLELLKHRGEDATGIAIHSVKPWDYYRLRLTCRDADGWLPRVQEIAKARGSWIAHRIEQSHSPYQVIEADLDLAPEQVEGLYRQLDDIADLCVHSFSNRMAIYKDAGGAANLTGFAGIRADQCSHMIGHVRLATESVDNLNFAHPFSSAVRPDLAIVHNGQLTNYFNLRRKLSAQGVPFKTTNDSELIAHYLAYKTAIRGKSLEAALHESIDELDGVYSYVVSTATEMGCVQDRLGLKPIVIYEADTQVLLGSEQLCFSAFESEAAGVEITPGEVRMWSHSTVPV